jgi:hypothetical protein
MLLFLSLSVDKIKVIHRFDELSTDFGGRVVEYSIQLVTLCTSRTLTTTLLHSSGNR